MSFMSRPSGDLKVNRADEILAVIEIHFNLLLSISLGEKLFRMIDQFLESSRWVGPEFNERHNHTRLHLFQNLRPTARKDFAKLGVDFVLRRLATFLPRHDLVRKFGQ